MNPLRITERLQESLINYLMTTFDVNRDGQHAELADQIRDTLSASSALFNGPFLELAPPYARGRTLLELIDEAILDRRLAKLPCFHRGKPLPLDAPLYTHQEAAIRRISGEGRGVVVSSGTGSGKTESFLIPILNDLLIDPSPGVRAVLIYPLNALVNDQLDRLRELLHGTSVTFGRYTSELESSTQRAMDAMQQQMVEILPNEVISREQIRKEGKLPQILITNYAMLEYLLLRPQDDVLFRSGAWRFLVLDEAHSYTGAKGIEVSLLIRRLKLRLGKQRGEMRCIATSATLVNDDRDSAQRFAQDLFGEPYSAEDIILGRHDQDALMRERRPDETPSAASYNAESVQELLDGLQTGQAQAADVFDKLRQAGWPAAALEGIQQGSSASAALYAALRHNQHLQDLLLWMLQDREGQPVALHEAARQAFGDVDAAAKLSEDERLEALHHLVELGSQARPSEDGAPLLPARYHLFARPSQGLWACLNPDCVGRNTSPEAPWSRLYSTPHVTCDFCGCAAFPLFICRACGQVYVRAEEDGQGHMHSDITQGVSAEERRPRYFTWSLVHPDASLGEDDGDGEDDSPSRGLEAQQPQVGSLNHKAVSLCLNNECRRTRSCACANPHKVTLYRIDEEAKDGKGSRALPVEAISQCYRCQTESRVKSDEIATPLRVTGSTPLGVLVSEMYRNLPPSPKPEQRDKPGQGRKLLSFYDSRQGAARFAAFLQDVFNQDLSRTIVPRATRALEDEHKRPVDFAEVTKRCVKIGWEELHVFQNDHTLEGIDTQRSKLSGSDRERLLQKVQARVLAELTVNRRSRQSLESLGLLAVEYFEEAPQVDDLAAQSGLSAEQVRLLARYLLDTLRQEKTVTMPKEVEADDSAFGRNTGHPRVVRGKPQKSETPWAGQTTQHRRYRLVERMLKGLGKPADEAQVRALMDGLWEMLLREEVLEDVGSGARRLSLRNLYLTTQANWYRCTSCQRLSHDAASLPCPHCGGVMQPADMEAMRHSNYYYQVLSGQLQPMRVEEHTAQLQPQLGRRYQNAFKQGDINILSCSTTFEMGIDLGDLQAVFLNNVPPSVANYRQRAGRAGRRAGGAAMIVTWATDRPHDQLYFSDPASIIRGAVRVPQIHLANHEIGRRHIRAILLSEFLRHCHQMGRTDLDKLDPFFNPQAVLGPHVQELRAWAESCRAYLNDLLRLYAVGVGFSVNEGMVDEFICKLEDQAKRYNDIRAYYEQAEQQMAQHKNYKEAEEYKKLLNRLANEELIDTLSNRGVLPSYSFPLEVVELEIPVSEQERYPLRLQRDLRQAIREYAPGAEVVANKRLWKSGAVQFYRDTPQIYKYRLCSQCGHLEVASDPAIPLDKAECPICGEAYAATSGGQYLTPDGFRATEKSKAATQYVAFAPSTMRTALFLRSQPPMEQPSALVSLGYSREGKLYFLNEGMRGGFKICKRCGKAASHKDKACKGRYRGAECGSEEFYTVSLGHRITTDTLQIRLHSSDSLTVSQDKSFLYSLLYALLQGASRALQIDRQDIDGLLYPFPSGAAPQSYEISLALYDNVPGGAGHVQDIQKHFARVVQEAYQIVSSCDCAPNTSCVRCLRDYNNQFFYPYLRRDVVIPFLEALSIELSQDKAQRFVTVKPVNGLSWLTQRLGQARGEVWLAAEALTSDPIATQRDSWIDLLRDLLNRDVRVTLLLSEDFDPHKRDHLGTARHLQTLLETGYLRLLRGPRLPEWPILHQQQDGTPRAVRLADGALRLDGQPIASALHSSTDSAIVQQAQADFRSAQATAQSLTIRDLDPPSNTRVYTVERATKQREDKIEALQDLFSQPVRYMTISDRYLIDHERLFNRVSAYIELANRHNTLERVLIRTCDAGKQGREAQSQAARKLEQRYPFAKVERPQDVEHDRYILVTYLDGSKAKLLIGRGLDFIRADGTTEPTHLVIQRLS